MATQTQSTLLEAQRRMSRHREQRMAVMAEAQNFYPVPKSAAVNAQYAPPRQDSTGHRSQHRSKQGRPKVTTQAPPPPHPSVIHPPTRSSSRKHQPNGQMAAQPPPLPVSYQPDPTYPADRVQRNPSRYRRQPVLVTTQVPPRPQYVQGPRILNDEAMQRYQARTYRMPPEMMPPHPMMEYSQNVQPGMEDVLRKSKSRYRRKTDADIEDAVPLGPFEPEPVFDEQVYRSKSGNRRMPKTDYHDAVISSPVEPHPFPEETTSQSRSRSRSIPIAHHEDQLPPDLVESQALPKEAVPQSKPKSGRIPTAEDTEPLPSDFIELRPVPDEPALNAKSRSQPMSDLENGDPLTPDSVGLEPVPDNGIPQSKSRYRRVPQPDYDDALPLDPVEPQYSHDEGVLRSQSRYRRMPHAEYDYPLPAGPVEPEAFHHEQIYRSRSGYRRLPIPDYEEPLQPRQVEPHLIYDETVQRSRSRYRQAAPVIAPNHEVQNLVRVLSDPQLSRPQPRMVPSHSDSRLYPNEIDAQMAMQQQRMAYSDPRLIAQDTVLRKEMSLDSMHRAHSHALSRPPPTRPQTSAEAQAMFIQQQQYQMAYAQQHQAQSARAEARQLLENEAERQRRLTLKIKAQKAEEHRQKQMQEAEEQRQKAEVEKRQAEVEKQRVEEERLKSEESEKQRLKLVEEEQAARARRQLEDQQAAEAKRQRNEERTAELLRRKQAKETVAEQQRVEKEQVASERKEKSRDLKRPDNVTSSSSNAASSVTSANAPNKDRFGFLKRRKGDDAPKSADILGRTKSTRGNGPPQTIRPGGGGVVPGIDAPVSAVNAGERRVTVECDRASISLPVTPSTTPSDLITSAATCLSVNIDPKTSVLLESFGKVGVQRPLRNYEHVRDIMNSWDDDQDNVLVIVPSATGGKDDDLEVESVPTEQPPEMSCFLLYSQNPGKWDKRWVTLRADGQVVHSKKEDGKNSTNVCHMSDFDIYSPTPKELAKKIKPPKKLCFAIKSQQKSSMFLTTASFVHFFATGDKKTAATWYKAIQTWRSWYLVNVMGEGQGFGKSGGNRESHYQLGSFKPLIDMDDFGLGGTSTDKPEAPLADSPQARNVSARNRQGPPSSFPKNFANGVNGTSGHEHGPSFSTSIQSNGASVEDDDTFAPKGLLGRTYSQRQKAQRERDQAAKNASPFTFGTSLLNDINTSAAVKLSLDLQGPWTGSHQHSSSTAQQNRSRSDSTRDGVRPSMDIKRSASTHKPAQPLVDLTPRYQEPPQHTRKGKGYVPEQVGPGGLIDLATSPENAIAIPPANDWRARPSADLSRSRSVRRTADGNDEGSAELAEALARFPSAADAGQGTATGGRGVIDGAHAARTGKPMLNLGGASGGSTGGSKFAVGSLLERVWKEKLGRDGTGAKVAEKGATDGGLVIDRSKAKEVSVGTGEGL